MFTEKIISIERKNYKDIALSYHRQGFACSQAVLAAYAPEFGIERELALKISTPFAGGMARLGETCGVVTGALMVIGLRYGKCKPGDDRAKEETYYYTEEFIDRFNTRNRTILCRELIDCKLNTPKGLKYFREEKINEKICQKFVIDATAILDEIL